MDVLLDGTPVKLPGVGTFTPSVDGEGTYNIGFRADSDLKNGINAANSYQGEIRNRERIGWTQQQYKELWDSEHPQDPLQIDD